MAPRNLLALIQQQAALVNLHLDANETAALDRAFRHTEAQIQRVEYPELMHSMHIPLDTSIPEWAETVHYTAMDSVGSMKPIANFADDMPRTDVVLYEEEIPVKAWGGSYQYSVEELMRASAPGGMQLDVQRAIENRNVAEQQTDYTAWFGHAQFKIRGFATNEMVEVLGTNADGGDYTWAAKIANGDTGKESVLKDITDALNAIVEDTKQVHAGTDALLPTALYSLLQVTKLSSQSDATMLTWLKNNFPSVTFSSVPRLNTANAAGTGPRIVVYKKNPTILQHKLPMSYRTFPPQAKNLAFVVNGMMRTAGTHIYRPKAVKYIDGAG